MFALERWGKGRFAPLVEVAHEVALSAEAIHEVIHKARGRRMLVPPGTKPFAVEEWLQLYRRPCRIRTALLQMLRGKTPNSDLEKTRRALNRARRRWNAQVREQLKEVLAKGTPKEDRLEALAELEREHHENYLPYLKEIIGGGETVPKAAELWFPTVEFQFFFTVVMPCLLEYRTTPWTLYRKARIGNIEAFECLLRLDEDADKCEALKQMTFGDGSTAIELTSCNGRELKD